MNSLPNQVCTTSLNYCYQRTENIILIYTPHLTFIQTFADYIIKYTDVLKKPLKKVITIDYTTIFSNLLTTDILTSNDKTIIITLLDNYTESFIIDYNNDPTPKDNYEIIMLDYSNKIELSATDRNNFVGHKISSSYNFLSRNIVNENIKTYINNYKGDASYLLDHINIALYKLLY